MITERMQLTRLIYMILVVVNEKQYVFKLPLMMMRAQSYLIFHVIIIFITS